MSKEIDLQKEHERATAKLNQLKGRRDALLARLKNEYNYDTVEQANEALEQMEAEYVGLEAQYKTAYDAFISEYGHRIGT